jgi:hypothetical protein
MVSPARCAARRFRQFSLLEHNVTCPGACAIASSPDRRHPVDDFLTVTPGTARVLPELWFFPSGSPVAHTT